MANSMKPLKIAGKLFWCKDMVVPPTKFNEDNTKFHVTIGGLSDKAVEAIEGLGIQVKNRDPMGNFIVGKSKFAFEPTLEDGNKVDPMKIGNETECWFLVNSYSHKMDKKFGKGVSVSKIVITKLRLYEPDVAIEEEVDEAL